MKRLWLLLTGLGAAGFLLALPFLLHAIRGAGPPIAPAVLLLLQFLQTMLLVAVAAWAGARLTPRLGLDAPWLRAIAERRERPPDFGSMLIESLAVGSVAAMAVNGVLLALRSSVPAALWAASDAGFWTRASGAFYGGIVEEILVRWALLSALWVLVRRLGIDSFWIACLLSALIFGALHLPSLRLSHIQLTAPVITHVLLGNGLYGLVLGWLFKRRGLEGAMFAHAAADVWQHALLPVLLA